MSNTLFLQKWLPGDCHNIINEFVHGHKCLNGCSKCDVDMSTLYAICSKCSFSRPMSFFMTAKNATVCMKCKIHTRMNSDASRHFAGWLDYGNRRKGYMTNIPYNPREYVIELGHKLMKVKGELESYKNCAIVDCELLLLVRENELTAKKYEEYREKYAKRNAKEYKKNAKKINENNENSHHMPILTQIPNLPTKLTHLYCYDTPPEPPLTYTDVCKLYLSKLNQHTMKNKQFYLKYMTTSECGNPVSMEITRLRNQISNVYKEMFRFWITKYWSEKMRVM